MSKLLWFVLGGVAVGAGIAAVMLNGEAESNSSEDSAEDDQLSIPTEEISDEQLEEATESNYG